jgi:putative aminopeptidase FrvX
VVIEAHADEISWFVNYINDQGLIYLKRNGGVDHQVAPAKRVWIHGKKGPVKAVFGWPAIHTRLGNPEQKEPQPKVDNLCLDCGARKKKKWKRWVSISALWLPMKKDLMNWPMIILSAVL